MVDHTIFRNSEIFRGLDTKSSDISRNMQYSSDMRNAMYKLSGAICKRKGFSLKESFNDPIKGMTSFKRVSTKTGVVTDELISVIGKKVKSFTNRTSQFSMYIDERIATNNSHGTDLADMDFKITYDSPSQVLRVYHRGYPIYKYTVSNTDTIQNIADRVSWGINTAFNKYLTETLTVRAVVKDKLYNVDTANQTYDYLKYSSTTGNYEKTYGGHEYNFGVDFEDIDKDIHSELDNIIKSKGIDYLTKISTYLTLDNKTGAANPYFRLYQRTAASINSSYVDLVDIRGLNSTIYNGTRVADFDTEQDPNTLDTCLYWNPVTVQFPDEATTRSITHYKIGYYYTDHFAFNTKRLIISVQTISGPDYCVYGAISGIYQYGGSIYSSSAWSPIKFYDIGEYAEEDLLTMQSDYGWNLLTAQNSTATQYNPVNTAFATQELLDWKQTFENQVYQSIKVSIPFNYTYSGSSSVDLSTPSLHDSIIKYVDTPVASAYYTNDVWAPTLDELNNFRNSVPIPGDWQDDLDTGREDRAANITYNRHVFLSDTQSNYLWMGSGKGYFPEAFKKDNNSTNRHAPYGSNGYTLQQMGYSGSYYIRSLDNFSDGNFPSTTFRDTLYDNVSEHNFIMYSTFATDPLQFGPFPPDNYGRTGDIDINLGSSDSYISGSIVAPSSPYVNDTGFHQRLVESHDSDAQIIDQSPYFIEIQNSYSGVAWRYKAFVYKTNNVKRRVEASDITTGSPDYYREPISKCPINIVYLDGNASDKLFSELDSFNINLNSSNINIGNRVDIQTVTVADKFLDNVQSSTSLTKECFQWQNQYQDFVLNEVSTENCTFASLNNVLYLSNGLDNIMKYDGSFVYKAGLPNAADPNIAEDFNSDQTYLYLFEYTDFKNNTITSEPKYFDNSSDPLPTINDPIFSGYDVYSRFDAGWQEENNITLNQSYTDGYALERLTNQTRMRLKIYRRNTAVGAHYLAYDLPLYDFDFSIDDIGYSDYSVEQDTNLIYSPDVKRHDPPPKGRYLSTFKNCLVVSGQYENANNVQYSLPYSSATLEIGSEYFPSDDNAIIAESKEGDRITAIYPFRDIMYVFHNNSISSLSGDISVLETPSVRSISQESGIGCVSNYSIQELQGQVVFLSSKGFYSIFNTVQVRKFSEIIDNLFLDTSSNNRTLNRAVSYIWEDKELFISVIPEFTYDQAAEKYFIDPDNTLILAYDYSKQAWLRWDTLEFTGGIATFDNEVYFGKVANATTHKVCKISNDNLSTDYSDEGSAINFYYETNWESLDQPSIPKKFLRLKMHFMDVDKDFENDGFSLKVAICKDYIQGETASININLENVFNQGWGTFAWGSNTWGGNWGGGVNNLFVKHKLPNFKAKSLKLIFSNNDNNQNIFINNWEYELANTYRQEIKD